MRRYFYDTEFMEEPGFLELISIGVISEDGDRMFHAANLDADLSRANDWVKGNVIPKFPSRDAKYPVNGAPVWMSYRDIAENLNRFLMPSESDPVEMWGYYADYDHVLLCWLFGRMVDLPAGMPMYTLDLRQYAYHLGDPALPVVQGEHDALNDAKWNREVYLMLKENEKSRG